MLYEPTCLDNEDKEGDNLNGNRLINLKILTINIYNVLMWRHCAQEKAPQMKLEEEIIQGKIISYFEAYYDLTMKNKSKGIRKLHHDFNTQTYNRETSSQEDSFIMTFSEHSNALASTIVCNYSGNKNYKRYSNHKFNLHFIQKRRHHYGNSSMRHPSDIESTSSGPLVWNL